VSNFYLSLAVEFMWDSWSGHYTWIDFSPVTNYLSNIEQKLFLSIMPLAKFI